MIEDLQLQRFSQNTKSGFFFRSSLIGRCVNLCYGYNIRLGICLERNIRIPGDGKIFDFQDVSGLHVSHINFNFVQQMGRIRFVGDLVQQLLHNAGVDFFMVSRKISVTA